jgi:putative PIN family toxin of toxin-antitoxin system
LTRIVVDPGVLVSAFISPHKAAPAILMDAILDGNVELVLSPTLVAELTDVLGREKFAEHAADGRAEAFIAMVKDRAETAADSVGDTPRTRDPDDDYLLALAETQQVDALVSGDPHLLAATTAELPVRTPREVVNELGLDPDARR